MSTTPLRLDVHDDARPRDWRPRKIGHKGPLRLVRLCVLGAFLPAVMVAYPIYLRYRVYSEQVYPLAASDQRLIDGRVSTTWCQVLRVNATFNAYLMKEAPKIERETIPISMTRHLVLEDDMKEYWGFYLLRGSSVTVSTCVRWPGASLTIIRGHKHLHECAFIGDDSSEELEELAKETHRTVPGSTNNNYTIPLLQPFRSPKPDGSPSNVPEKMKRAREEVRFHEDKDRSNETTLKTDYVPYNGDGSNELDAAAMRKILATLFVKTMDTKKRQRENPHNHYPDVFEKSLMKVSVPTTTTTMTTTTAIPRETSAEIFLNVLRQLDSMGDKGEQVLRRLVDEIDRRNSDARRLKKILGDAIGERNNRIKRQLTLASILDNGNSVEDTAENAALEKDYLYPDGIAQDRGTVNETSPNDGSNSEFWSSFSSSEERLLECKGLVLNLPLNPHVHCSPKHEDRHSSASMANGVTYRIPTDGYYFFVFNSENEIQPNYMRIKFDLVKTVYNTSNPVDACKNTTGECGLPLNFFSHEKIVLELPVNGNESQWNEGYVVVSTCEPRTSLYLICVITVPLLVLLFAFH